MTVEHVDVPDGFKRGVRTVGVGIRHSERVEIASESVVPHGFQYPKKLCRICDEASVLKQNGEVGIGLRNLGVRLHHISCKKKIPVATIGRSLSGGVTDASVSNRADRRNGKFGKFDFMPIVR